MLKIGDKVRCKPNFDRSDDSGGYGYYDGLEFTIEKIDNKNIAWSTGIPNGGGIYLRALELVNSELQYEIC